MADLDLPESVLSLVEFHPVEDVLLYILRARLPEVPIYSEIPEVVPNFFVLVRREPDYLQGGDVRFVDAVIVSVQVFVTDPDGDEKGALVSEAVRVSLRDAWLEGDVAPGLGSISRFETHQMPSRRTDWATSTGPVQYADLPTGMWRYEATYELDIRRPI